MTDEKRDVGTWQQRPEPVAKNLGASAAGSTGNGQGGEAYGSDDDRARATLHDFRQPIQSASAWTDMCRLYISGGDTERAIEALSRVSRSIEEIEHRAAPLIDAFLSRRPG
jgi:hypothetical protein